MSNGSGKKKNSTTARTTAAIPVVAEVEAPAAPIYELGDAPKHLRFDPQRDLTNKVIIADGYISNGYVLAALPRFTTQQKTVKEFIAKGDGVYTHGSPVSCVEKSEVPSLSDVRWKMEMPKPPVQLGERPVVEAVSQVRLVEDNKVAAHYHTKQVLEVTADHDDIFFCDAKYLAPLITMAGGGARVSIHNGKAAVVYDRNNEFVGLVGLLLTR